MLEIKKNNDNLQKKYKFREEQQQQNKIFDSIYCAPLWIRNFERNFPPIDNATVDLIILAGVL